MKITTLFDLLFGCHHGNLSRVFTIRRRSYRVCCDCGAEFDYSIKEMAIRRRQMHGPSQGELERAGRATA